MWRLSAENKVFEAAHASTRTRPRARAIFLFFFVFLLLLLLLFLSFHCLRQLIFMHFLLMSESENCSKSSTFNKTEKQLLLISVFRH